MMRTLTRMVETGKLLSQLSLQNLNVIQTKFKNSLLLPPNAPSDYFTQSTYGSSGNLEKPLDRGYYKIWSKYQVLILNQQQTSFDLKRPKS